MFMGATNAYTGGWKTKNLLTGEANQSVSAMAREYKAEASNG